MMRTTMWLLFLLAVVSATVSVVRSRDSYIGLVNSPELISFTATPAVVIPGQAVTIAWRTRNVPLITILNGPENPEQGGMQRHIDLPPTGSITILPKEDSVFVLECQTGAGLKCPPARATVRVNQATGEINARK